MANKQYNLNFDLDGDTISSLKCMNFPKSVDVKKWENYLGRKLNNEELFYLENVKTEKKFNEYIVQLHNIAKSKGLYIPYLTGLYGNCMFESLTHHKIFESDDEFRKNLSFLMYIFKDYKNLFPNQESSISELFVFANDIEHVISKNEKKLFKYNFDLMCRDLATEFCWSRLPTELIMMVISYFYNVKFYIVSNTSDYVNVIHTCLEENPLEIYLGHINEMHYVPLVKRNDDPVEDVILKHSEAKDAFFKWAITIWRSKNSHVESEDVEKIDESKNPHNNDKLNDDRFVEMSRLINNDNNDQSDKHVDYE